MSHDGEVGDTLVRLSPAASMPACVMAALPEGPLPAPCACWMAHLSTGAPRSKLQLRPPCVGPSWLAPEHARIRLSTCAQSCAAWALLLVTRVACLETTRWSSTAPLHLMLSFTSGAMLSPSIAQERLWRQSSLIRASHQEISAPLTHSASTGVANKLNLHTCVCTCYYQNTERVRADGEWQHLCDCAAICARLTATAHLRVNSRLRSLSMSLRSPARAGASPHLDDPFDVLTLSNRHAALAPLPLARGEAKQGLAPAAHFAGVRSLLESAPLLIPTELCLSAHQK